MNTNSEFKFKSFIYAFSGLKEAFSQANFRIHILAAIAVIAAGYFLKISSAEWCLVLLSIGIVLASECFNTAIEFLTNIVSPGINPAAGKIKDLSAGAVLICALFALITGLIIFIPKLIQ